MFWRIRQDWTQLSFILYGVALWTLFLAFEEYRYDEPYQLVSALLLAAGAAVAGERPRVWIIDLDGVRRVSDVFRASLTSTVNVTPALATPNRAAPRITAIEPPFASARPLPQTGGEGKGEEGRMAKE